MNMRLKSIEKDLYEKLSLVDEKKLRSAALAACELVFNKIVVDVPVVTDALGALRLGKKIPLDVIAALNNVAAEFDAQYFDLQESIDGEQALSNEALQLFSCARAVSALAFAGEPDPLTAASEAIYEASSAVDDQQYVLDAIHAVL